MITPQQLAEEEKRLVQRGFSTIEIEKNKLLQVIKENKDKHVKEYKDACKAYEAAKLAYAQDFWSQMSENFGLYRKKMEEKLEAVAELVLKARNNHQEDKKIDLAGIDSYLNFNYQPQVKLVATEPISHEKEYNEAIRNLELTTAEFIYLDQTDFRRYILDEWDWKVQFNYNNSLILNGSTMTGNLYFGNSGNMVVSSGCYAPVYSGISTVENHTHSTELLNILTTSNGQTKEN
jgi:hypothetical protein